MKKIEINGRVYEVRTTRKKFSSLISSFDRIIRVLKILLD